MNSQDPTELLTPDERKLYELMSEISEDCYFAGWMVGNEYTLWSSIQTGEMRYGMSDIDRDLLAQVAALAVKTGCWIVWRDYKDGLPRNDSSTWGPYAIPLVEWNAIYEAKNDMRPERATQPAQRKSQIDIHWITCEEARKIGGGLIDTIPADDVTALGRAIYQRILDSQPAQDQVAAVRAVPDIEQKAKAAMYLDELTAAQEGQKWLNGFIDQGATIAYSEDSGPQAPRVKWAAIFNSYDRMVAGYLLTRDAMNWTELTLIDCSAGAKATTPSPQPELSGSIDTPELRELLRSLHACPTETLEIDLDETIASINAWKNAACAAAVENAQAEVVTWKRYAEGVEKRATDAEAKLAAIQSQAARDALLEAVRSVLREELDSANVHPCDSNNDDARTRQLSPLMQNLYRAAMREQQP